MHDNQRQALCMAYVAGLLDGEGSRIMCEGVRKDRPTFLIVKKKASSITTRNFKYLGNAI